jgi:hypothetical protein
MDRLDHRVRCRRQETVHEMRPGNRLRLGAANAIPFGLDVPRSGRPSSMAKHLVEALGAGAGVDGCAAGPTKAHGLRQRGRRRDGRDRRIGHRRALAAYSVGPKCRDP